MQLCGQVTHVNPPKILILEVIFQEEGLLILHGVSLWNSSLSSQNSSSVITQTVISCIYNYDGKARLSSFCLLLIVTAPSMNSDLYQIVSFAHVYCERLAVRLGDT